MKTTKMAFVATVIGLGHILLCDGYMGRLRTIRVHINVSFSTHTQLNYYLSFIICYSDQNVFNVMYGYKFYLMLHTLP